MGSSIGAALYNSGDPLHACINGPRRSRHYTMPLLPLYCDDTALDLEPLQCVNGGAMAYSMGYKQDFLSVKVYTH